jgi:hypothetical protein
VTSVLIPASSVGSDAYREAGTEDQQWTSVCTSRTSPTPQARRDSPRT